MHCDIQHVRVAESSDVFGRSRKSIVFGLEDVPMKATPLP